jgi:hypothetical protein
MYIYALVALRVAYVLVRSCPTTTESWVGKACFYSPFFSRENKKENGWLHATRRWCGRAVCGNGGGVAADMATAGRECSCVVTELIINILSVYISTNH